MAKYQVLEKSFIGGVYHDPEHPKHNGQPLIIEFDGIPAANLKPIDEEGKKAAAKLPESNKKDEKRFALAAAGGEPEQV